MNLVKYNCNRKETVIENSETSKQDKKWSQINEAAKNCRLVCIDWQKTTYLHMKETRYSHTVLFCVQSKSTVFIFCVNFLRYLKIFNDDEIIKCYDMLMSVIRI